MRKGESVCTNSIVRADPWTVYGCTLPNGIVVVIPYVFTVMFTIAVIFTLHRLEAVAPRRGRYHRLLSRFVDMPGPP